MIYDRLLPSEGLFCAAPGIQRGAVGHYLGVLAAVLGRDTDAEAHFSAATAMHARLNVHFHLARTKLEWARMLSGRGGHGDRDRAVQLLHEAHASARAHRCGQIERRASRLLTELGGIRA
jgi:hypothetical protein